MRRPIFAIVIGPTGTYAYMVNGGADILQYSIGADGTLTPLNTPRVSIPGGGEFRDIVVAPSGKYAYTVAWDYTTGNPVVGQYAVGTDGALTAMSTPQRRNSHWNDPTADRRGSFRQVRLRAEQRQRLAIHHRKGWNTGNARDADADDPGHDSHGAVAHRYHRSSIRQVCSRLNAGDTTLSQYKIGASIGAYGALASLSPATVPAVLAGSYGMWISVDPSGQYAYVGKWDNTNVLAIPDRTRGAHRPWHRNHNQCYARENALRQEAHYARRSEYWHRIQFSRRCFRHFFRQYPFRRHLIRSRTVQLERRLWRLGWLDYRRRGVVAETAVEAIQHLPLLL